MSSNILGVDYGVPRLFMQHFEIDKELSSPSPNGILEIDPQQIELITTLREGEVNIWGTENLQRIREAYENTLGVRDLEEFFKKPDAIPTRWMDYVAIYFLRDVFRNSHKGICVPRMFVSGKEWKRDHAWLDGLWDKQHPTAVLKTLT